MSNLTQFLGGAATTSIVNAHSSGGTQVQYLAASTSNGMVAVSSGALVANTLKTLLTVSGQGLVSMLTAYALDTTARTVRLVVEVDGAEVFDATSSAISNGVGYGIYAAGANYGGSMFGPGEPIVFNDSLVVKVASSVSETDKVAMAYRLHLR